VDYGASWAWTTMEAAVEKGAHKLATMEESIALIAEDVAYQAKAGYAQVISWEELQILLPKQLKVSPLGVVPQWDQRGRMILDLSFVVSRGKPCRGRKVSCGDNITLQPSVDDTTERLAPEAR
jgi:hypothetical protein